MCIWMPVESFNYQLGNLEMRAYGGLGCWCKSYLQAGAGCDAAVNDALWSEILCCSERADNVSEMQSVAELQSDSTVLSNYHNYFNILIHWSLIRSPLSPQHSINSESNKFNSIQTSQFRPGEILSSAVMGQSSLCLLILGHFSDNFCWATLNSLFKS